VLVEAHVREALIMRNPEITEKPDRADEGCGCDVYSPGELNVALRAGVAPQLISVNGVPRDAAHIRRSIQVGARLTIDNVEELAVIEQAAADLGQTMKIRLRLFSIQRNPCDVWAPQVSTHPATRKEPSGNKP
jgi:diaminopimelate decarboxylase